MSATTVSSTPCWVRHLVSSVKSNLIQKNSRRLLVLAITIPGRALRAAVLIAATGVKVPVASRALGAVSVNVLAVHLVSPASPPSICSYACPSLIQKEMKFMRLLASLMKENLRCKRSRRLLAAGQTLGSVVVAVVTVPVANIAR